MCRVGHFASQPSLEQRPSHLQCGRWGWGVLQEGSEGTVRCFRQHGVVRKILGRSIPAWAVRIHTTRKVVMS